MFTRIRKLFCRISEFKRPMLMIPIHNCGFTPLRIAYTDERKGGDATFNHILRVGETCNFAGRIVSLSIMSIDLAPTKS